MNSYTWIHIWIHVTYEFIWFFIYEFICFMNSYTNSGVPRFQMPGPGAVAAGCHRSQVGCPFSPFFLFSNFVIGDLRVLLAGFYFLTYEYPTSLFWSTWPGVRPGVRTPTRPLCALIIAVLLLRSNFVSKDWIMFFLALSKIQKKFCYQPWTA